MIPDKTKKHPTLMKSRLNPFLSSIALASAFLVIGQSSHAANYWFDNNGTTLGYGVVNGGSYDWTAGTPWSTTSSGAFTVAGIAWPGGTNLAGFVGAGASTSYTMTLGASDSSTVTLQNLILNSDGTNAAAIGSGDVVIGGVGSTGTLSLSAANSIGTAAGTLTINSKYNLGNNQNTNFRGGTIIINGVISGTGTSGVTLGSGAFGLTSGTLTLAGDNTFAGSTSVASGYTLTLRHANALGATGGTNSVSAGGTTEVAGGVTINSGESIGIAGDGVSSFGALRAGTGGGTWAGGVTLNGAGAGPRLGATAGNTLTITGSIANGSGTSFNVSGQSGTGVVILNPTTSNSYTGTSGIIRGILRLGKNDALPTGTTLDVDSINNVTDAASFDMAGFNQTVAALQDSATNNVNGKVTNSVASTTSTLTVNQASSTDFGGIIENGSGSIVLTKSGAGNLTLSGANTYTGGTNIKNGSIIIGGGNDRLATGGSVVLGDAGTSGKLVLGDSTTARNQTLAGLTTTGLGGSVVGAHATTNSVLTLSFTSGTNTYAGTLGGAGTNENKLALTKSGAGTLKLTGANTYSGPTTLTQGTLQIGVDPVGAITSSAIGTGTLTFNGGTLSSDSSTARSIGNAVTFTGNAVLGDATNNGKLTFSNNMDLGAAARTITVSSAVQLDGSFTNSAATSGLIKLGTGTLTINGANTSFGNTAGFTIGNGTVVAANTASMGNVGQIVTLSSASGFGTLDLATDTTANAYVLNFGSVAGAGGTVLVNRATSGAAITHTMGVATLGNAKVNAQAGGNVTSGTPTLEFTGINLSAGAGGDGATTFNPTTANILISGSISRSGSSANSLVLDGSSSGNLISGIISGPQTLTKSNTSTWELSNANTFAGNTKVTGGTLKLTNSLAIQSSAFDTSGAGTLDISTINNPTFGGLTSATSYALPSNVTSLTLNPSSGATQTYSGNLSRTGGGSGLTLTKTGAGTQILSGTNSYTGLTTVNGGELRVTSAGAIGGTNVTVTTGQLALDGGVTVSGKSLTTSGSGTNFFGGLQSVSGTNTWDGSVTLGADLSRLGARKNATLVVSGVIDDGSNTYGMVVRNENVGNNNNGVGNSNTVTVLSGVNTYGGNTQLIHGVTKLDGGDNRLPVGTVLQFGSATTNAKFDMNGRNQELAGLAVTSTSTDSNRDWNANELTNSSATLSTLTVNTVADQTFGGTLTNNVGLITGKIALVKSGSAKLTLTSTNTFTDGTSIDNGTLALGHATDTLRDDGAVNVNGGELALGTNTDTVGAVTLTSGSITGTGAGKLTGTGSNFDVRSGTISAKLGGTVGLNKTTGGTVTITSDNSIGGYTGATNVSSGKLVVNGNISTSSLITVDSGATLAGSGTVGKTVINGTLAVGNSPGTMNFTDTLELNGATEMEIDGLAGAGVTGGHDFINLTGAGAAGVLIYGGTLSLNIGTTFGIGSYSWNLFDMASSTGNFTSISLTNQYAGSLLDAELSGVWNLTSGDNTWQFTQSTGVLGLTVVPEPNAALLGGLSALLLMRRRRIS